VSGGRIGRLALAIGLTLLAACSRDAPVAPAISLPTLADQSLERECDCVTAGRCFTPEAFEGLGEFRNFQCRWDDRAAGRATCSLESRFKHVEPPSLWSAWGRTTVRFRHLGDGGWCWTERSSENELTEPSAPR